MIEPLLRRAEDRHGVRAGDGLQLLTPEALLRQPFDPGWPVLLLPAPLVTEEPSASDEGSASGGPVGASDGRLHPPILPGRHARAAEPVALLRALYPADHPVHRLRDEPATLTVAELGAADLLSPLLLPAARAEANTASPHGLAWLAARLRAPDGCPWDRQQTHASLKRYLLEESYEVYDALEGGSTPALAEELGDLLLQVVLHAQYAAEAGVFDLTDVYRAIMTKIVRRHPHVFGDVEARSVDQVVRNWEQIKAGERAARGEEREQPRAEADERAAFPAAFSGLSRSLPALAYAQEMQERAASLGYDWPDLEGVIDKIAEEATELLGADDPDRRREEFGDLVFVIVNLGRKLGIDSEASLRAASAKFARRFALVERMAEERQLELRSLGLDALDELWEAAKAREARAAGSGNDERAATRAAEVERTLHVAMAEREGKR